MGAKLYADTTAKVLVVTLAPDGNGRVYVNTKVDIWSDLIEDWEASLALRRFYFPLVAIGGEVISTGKLGTSFVLLEPWQIAPYEADHEFVIDGNLATELEATTLVLPTVGGYTVAAKEKVSTLVEVAETGVSGLTSEEAAALAQIDGRVDVAVSSRGTDAETADKVWEVTLP